ncbi:TlpA disulfide reductase family protein [Patulibacter brassicae]|uniref:TlpA disulfide reductase family protein n=1 Tax=Patulibacter brassicae TaxID=1705717 RepID=A0ABU4VEF8_9ACTN|nr:TlpA disulfide reductase family protein [Patulibacter brassicae]MDX8150188.1 TlpA disulfide reductase family protein [Patulibacter brassicae]
MSRRSAVPLLLSLMALGLLAVLTYALFRPDGSNTGASLDAKVERGQIVPAADPDRVLQTLDGQAPKRLADYRGEIVILNFWASWCQPCEAEAPLLERAHRQLQRTKAGTVLGVTYNDSPNDSRGFVSKYRLTYPSLLDPGTDFAQQYGVRALPETFFIDREGRIRAIARGELTADFLDRSLKRTGYTGSGSAR